MKAFLLCIFDFAYRCRISFPILVATGLFLVHRDFQIRVEVDVGFQAVNVQAAGNWNVSVEGRDRPRQIDNLHNAENNNNNNEIQE